MTNASSNEQIISVCCKPDELDPADSFCYRNGSFPVWEIFTTIVSNFSIVLDPIPSRELVCTGGTFFDLEYYPPNNDVFYLREDGAIYVVKSKYGNAMDYELNITDYCFTSHLTENGRKGAIFVCGSFNFVHGFAIVHLIPHIAAGLSMPFLAATFFVYTILPELNNVAGFILRANVTSLFVTFTLMFINKANNQSGSNYVTVPVLYFSFMAYFIWLTVMCFDVWWTLRRVRSSQSQSKRENRKKCIIYSIFTWGISAFMTGVGVIIDSVPTVANGVIRPGFRDGWESLNYAAHISYWIGPIGCTITCDILFFVLTAITLIRHEKDMAHRLHEGDKQWYRNGKKRFYLYLKLFMVMGIACSADVINGLWGDKIPEYIGVLLDLPSSLQGVNIFVIFVCKKKIKKLLLKRFRGRDNTVPQNVELQPRN